jgi:phenylacetate-CoA ligase
MNYNKIKNFYNKIPKELLFFLNFLPYSFFCGAEYRRTIKKLHYFDLLSHEEKVKLRNEKLISYLNDAIRYTPFYRDYAKKYRIKSITDVEQFFDFPIISKDDVNESLTRFLDIRFINKRFKVSTGGSTGKQTELYLSNKCYKKEWAFVNFYLSSRGVDVNSKRLSLRGVSGISSENFLGKNPLYKELLVSPFKLSSKNIIDNYPDIKDFCPQWIHGYPSSITEFSNKLVSLDLKLPSIKHILLVSEKLYKQQFSDINAAFNAEVLSFYGMTERLIFATYENGSFWPHYMYGVCEEIDKELIGTGFINGATTLIRFRTGDSASVIKKNHFVHEITSLEGRWGRDYLVGFDGVKITMTALNTHCDSLSLVSKYQFKQYKIGECELLVVPLPGFNHANLNLIKNVFQQKVGKQLLINAKVVENIPLSKRGKHLFIINEI